MSSNLLKLATCAAIAILFGLNGASRAQDKNDARDKKQPKRIRIVVEAKDGKIIIHRGDGELKTIELPKVEGIDIRRIIERADKDGKGDANVQLKGKAIIVGPDGKVREIEFGDGGRAIRGGDAKIQGRIIVVGPDGKKREIEFGDARKDDGEKQSERKIRPRILIRRGDGKAEDLDIDVNVEQPAVRRAIRIAGVGAAGKYMIGVGCEPVGDALRAQLKLDEGVGLVVSQVFDDSPAAKAGVEKYDVIVAAGDKRISNLEQLGSAVQAAGKAGKKLSLQIIRGGERKAVEVKPSERKSGGFNLEGFKLDDLEIDNEDIRKRIHDALKGQGGFEFDKAIPGIARREFRILRGGSDLEKKVDTLNRQVKELQEAIKKLQKALEDRD